jgi:hypothetical protein
VVSFWSAVTAKLFMPFILIAFTLSSGFLLDFLSKRSTIPRLKARKKARSSEEVRAWITRTIVVLLSLTYTYVVVTLAQPFGCDKNQSGKYVLYSSPSLNCYDQLWYKNLGTMVFFIIIYIILIPGFLIHFFHKYKDDVNSSWFKSRFGAITVHFQDELFYWELFALFKKILFSLVSNVIAAFVGKTTKYFLVVCILFGFLLLEIVSFPYASDLSNQCNMLYVPSSAQILIDHLFQMEHHWNYSNCCERDCIHF